VTSVKLLHTVPDYEPLRAWAVCPVSSPPPGWQHLLRGGMVAWVRQTLVVPPTASHPPAGTKPVAALLARLLAAMIAEMIAQVSS
jgi:hypothetical protein